MKTKILASILCPFIAFTSASALLKSVQERTSTLATAQQAISSLPTSSQSQFVEILSTLTSLTQSQQRQLIANIHEEVSLMKDSRLSSAALAAQESVNKLQSVLKGGSMSPALQTQVMGAVYGVMNLANQVSPSQQTAIVQEMDSIMKIVTASRTDQTAQLAIQNQILNARQVLAGLGISSQTNFFTFVKNLASLIQSSGLQSCTLRYRDLQSELYTSMMELAQYVTSFPKEEDRTVQLDLHRDMLMTRQRLNSLSAASQLTFFQNINDLATLAISDLSLSGFQLKNQTIMVGILKALQSCTTDLQNRFIQQLADDTTLMLSKEAERIYQADIQSDITAARKELSGLSIEKQVEFFKNVLSNAQVMTGSPQVSSDTLAMEQHVNEIKAATLSFTPEERTNLWSQIRALVEFISGLSNGRTQKRGDYIALQSNVLMPQRALISVANDQRINLLTYANSVATFMAALSNSGTRLRSDHLTILTSNLDTQKALQDVNANERTNLYNHIHNLATFIAELTNTGTQLRSNHIELLLKSFEIQKSLKMVTHSNRTDLYNRMSEFATFIVGLNDTGTQSRSDHIALQPRILAVQRELQGTDNPDRESFYDQEKAFATFIAGLSNTGTRSRRDHLALQPRILTIQQTLKDVANTARQSFYDNANALATFIVELSDTGTRSRSDHIALQPRILAVQRTLLPFTNGQRQTFYTNEQSLATFIAGSDAAKDQYLELQPTILAVQRTLLPFTNSQRQTFYANEQSLATFIADLGNAAKRDALIALQSKIFDTQKALKDIPITAQQAFFNTLETMAGSVKEKVGTSTDERFTTQTATYMVTPGGIAKRAHVIKTSTSGLDTLTAFITPDFLSGKVGITGFGTNLIAFLKTTAYNATSYTNLKSKLGTITATTYASGGINADKLRSLKQVIAQQYTDSDFYFAQSQGTILSNMKAAMDLGRTSYDLVRSLALNLLVSAELGIEE